MSGVGGGRGGRGGRGRKKGGKKGLRQDMEVTFGHGKEITWPSKIGRQKYGVHWLKDSRQENTQHDHVTQSDSPAENKFTLRQLEGDKRVSRRLSEMGWSQKGWSGKSMNGRYVGCPESPDGEPLKNFHSVVVEFKRVANQTAAGKKRTLSAVVVVGNGDGVVGFGVGRGEESFTAIRKAKNKAVNYLHYVPRYNDYTLYHNVQVKYKETRVQLERTCQGTGLRCQRVIASIFQLAGIQDARAKITGSTNPLNVAKATLKGLTSQQMHQSISDESNHFLIENRRECFYRPVVLALPKSEDTAELKEYLQKKQIVTKQTMS